MTGINIDITERKLNEVALEESAQQLRRLATELNLAEQRERKRLATDMHDHLQQLLVTCKLKLRLAQGKRRGEDGGNEWDRLTNETDDLLAEALNYTRTLVAELSPPVLSEQGLGAGIKWLAGYMKRYGLVVSVSVPERRVRGLPEDQAVLLFQSARELLFNASKHAGTHEAWVTLEQKEGRLRIEVRDNGVGFAASPLNALSESSSKFGLFSIRERMSALGGSLHITSSPEVGTRAVLLLPLIKTTESPLPQSPGTAMQVSKEYRSKEDGVIQVLLVDDHAMVRQGLRAILESYPDLHVLGEAVDGREALEAVRVLRPHVVIMDVNMPVMDGIEATRCITQECPDTIVVGLSVNGGEDNREVMMKAGAVDLLTKEAAVEQLHESIMKGLNAPFPSKS
jgi:CheY-like chemotaxis protein